MQCTKLKIINILTRRRPTGSGRKMRKLLTSDNHNIFSKGGYLKSKRQRWTANSRSEVKAMIGLGGGRYEKESGGT